jgi:dTDP-4-dehydrorhamnose 3,5-epimerase
MEFKNGEIEGVTIKTPKLFNDKRGWLSEIFRHDELNETLYPVMSYISMTHPGVARGPHEHQEQWDYFCFIGVSAFKVYCWDNRPASPTYGNKIEFLSEKDKLTIVTIPPGVVHAYMNVGETEGMVLNYPNKLYAGLGKTEKVDEIRYEDAQVTPYVLT